MRLERAVMQKPDVIVLGAGAVGTSIALHLIKRGISAVLIDRRPPGEETSAGNAGIIEGNTLFPPAFPLEMRELVNIALKRTTSVNYDMGFLPRVSGWLARYAANSTPRRLVEIAKLTRPFFSRALAEHEELMAESSASRFLRKTGWIKIYRSKRSFERNSEERQLAKSFDIRHSILEPEEVVSLEPSLLPAFHQAVFWQDAASVTNPIEVTRAYARRFRDLGGTLILADARAIERSGGHWHVSAPTGQWSAAHAVIALGPWATDMLRQVRLSIPLAVKRGYNNEFKYVDGAPLRRPVLDVEHGFCLAPMDVGVRVTTGAEFASRDGIPTPVQLERVLPIACELLPLGERLKTTPWMGCRPCLPDSRPVIGAAPGHPGLWLALGHGHLGLTLSAATGRLMSELIAGVTPFCDPEPYAADRFQARTTPSSWS